MLRYAVPASAMRGKTRDHLPPDVLIGILTELKRSSDSPQALLASLRVNKDWFALVQPLLYGNIAIGQDRLLRFLDCLDIAKYGALIRSITLSVYKFDRLEYFTGVLPSFSNLSACSLHGHMDNDSIDRILQARPLTCKSLELDQSGRLSTTGADVHNCDTIIRILPRLHHCRISMFPVCGNICTDNMKDETRPILTPRLLSLSVICRVLELCQMAHSNVQTMTYSPWHSITSSLESFVAAQRDDFEARNTAIEAVIKDAGHPDVEGDDSDDDLMDRSIWPTYIRANFLTKTSIATPVLDTGWGMIDPASALICLPNDNKYMMTTFENAQTIGEGQLWSDATWKVRLPGEVLDAERDGKPSFAQGCTALPLLPWRTLQEWREANLRKMVNILRNEEVAGVRLMSAEVRQGDAYLPTEPIAEITPPDCVRFHDYPNMNAWIKKLGT